MAGVYFHALGKRHTKGDCILAKKKMAGGKMTRDKAGRAYMALLCRNERLKENPRVTSI